MKKDGKRPLLVACDIYRPAAIKQLQVVGGQVGVPVYEHGTAGPGQDRARRRSNTPRQHRRDVVILDTAGRLHIDEALMEELHSICEAVQPSEILLTIDAMTGQDAVNVANTFNEKLEIDRRDPHQAGRRYPRRRGALRARGDGQADQVRGHGRKADRSGSRSTRSAWPPAFSAWAT